MRLANMSRWPYGLLIAVLVAFPIALYVRIPKADPVRMDNVPIDRLTRSVWMPPGAKNPLPLPDGSELEVLGITKGVSGPVWGLDGKLLDDAAERRFRMALSDMGAKPTASNITLAFRLKASPDSMIDTSPMDGLETAGYSFSFSGQGLVVEVQSPSTTKPGRLRLAFEPELARPEHIATLSAGQGRQNGIEWVVETPSAIAAFLSKKKSDPTVECRLTLPGLMAGCAVKVRTDASVKGNGTDMDEWVFPEVVPYGRFDHEVRLDAALDDPQSGRFWHVYSTHLIHVEITPIPLQPAPANATRPRPK